MTKPRFYGLKSCDTCRRARKELSEAGLDFDPLDIRADGVPREVLERWLDEIGEASLINRKSATWRGLSDTQKKTVGFGGAVELLIQNPTLIKRPVIESDGKVLVGWSEEVRKSLGL